MRGPTHLAGGVATGVLLGGVMRSLGLGGDALGVLMVGGAALGSLMPDLDAPHGSYLEVLARKGMRARGKGVGVLAVRMLAVFLMLIAFPIRVFVVAFAVPHRGVLHSPAIPIAGFLLSVALLPASALLSAFLLGLSAGVFSHLLLDSCTPSGLSWFGVRVRGPIRTGSLMDAAMMLVLAAGALLIFAILWR